MRGLFSGASVKDEYARIREDAGRAISWLSEIEDVPAIAADILKDHVIESATLLRDQAEFVTSLVAKGTEARLRVPYSGGRGAFTLRHESLPHGTAIHGEVLGPNMATYGVKGPAVVLQETFTSPTSEALKAWGKERVDEIESILKVVNTELEEQNRMLRDFVMIQVQQRHQMLAAHDRLGDLGTGI